MRVTALFPLVPGDLAADAYVQVGPATATYRVVRIKHGALATDGEGTDATMAKLLGLTTHTTGTRIVLEGVMPHDVPWDATVTPLAAPNVVRKGKPIDPGAPDDPPSEGP